MNTLKIGADSDTLYAMLVEPPLDGLSIERPPSHGHLKSFDFNVDLTINIDLAKVTVNVAVLWIMARIGPDLRRGLEVCISTESVFPHKRPKPRR